MVQIIMESVSDTIMPNNTIDWQSREKLTVRCKRSKQAKYVNFGSRNMTMANWDPFRNISALQDHINRMFWEAFPDSKLRDIRSSLDAWCPSVDIHETK